MIKGTIIQNSVDSKLLKGNPAGLPPKRPLSVYIPAHCKGERYPVVYCLAPWTSAGRNLLDWKPFKESLPARIERLIDQGAMNPVVVVCPDLYTDYGGSQYIDSEYFGPHGRHLVEEVFPYVEEKFPVLTGPEHRGVFGRSSGGFGALRLAMDFPGTVAAVACHSGDLGFEVMLRGELVVLANGLAKYDGSIANFLDAIAKADKISGFDIHLLMLLGNAGFYSGDKRHPDGFELPVDLYDGSLRDEIWARWLQHDPVERIDHTAAALRQLKYLYLECGLKDQYNLLYGARQLHAKLSDHGVRHQYEEFNDNHSGTDYRYDISLPKMVAALL